MSVATELVLPAYAPSPAPAPRARLVAVPAPDQPSPTRVPARPDRRHPGLGRPQGAAGALADVHVLRPPADTRPATWHLTRRGVAVVAVAVALGALALLWLAVRSAPRPAPASVPGPAVVTVHTGDTLWSIATRVAPGVDPRAEVATLQRLNGLRGASLAPGERLHVR